jgi:hypothetical protein
MSGARSAGVGVACALVALCACSRERDANGRFQLTIANGLWPQPLKVMRDGEPVGEVRAQKGVLELAGHARQSLTVTTLTAGGWHGVSPVVSGPSGDALVDRLAQGGAPVPLSLTVEAPGDVTLAHVGVDGRDAPAAQVTIGQLPLPASTELQHYAIWVPSYPQPIQIGGATVGNITAAGVAVDVSGTHCYQLHAVSYSTLSVGFATFQDRAIAPARVHDKFEPRADYVFEDPPETLTVRTNGAPLAERVVYQVRPEACRAPATGPKR